MQLRDLAFAAIAVLSLIGCGSRTASSDASAPATEAAAAQLAAPAPSATSAPAAQDGQAPIAASQDTEGKQAPVENGSDLLASGPSRSCNTDSDCAVKDVGSCCGYFPMCVNKDARTDPAAVSAQCEKDGMSSICGFTEVSGCQCVQGQCENLAEGPIAQ